jgi:hypothetical protein
VRPSELVRVIVALLPTRRPIYLWGPPGVGKSSIVRQAAEVLKLALLDLRVTLLDPVDLRGLPQLSKDAAVWFPPAFLPRTGTGILFLDELAQAPPLVQSGCLQLSLDRRLGEYELPAGWTVVAASNRTEDRAGTHRLITPLLNRFVHLDLDVSNEDWQDWAVAAGVAPEVRAFLRFRPGLLFQFDPSVNARAFATPRSWVFVSDVLAATPEDLATEVVAGCVGEGPAAEFAGFTALYRELPDVDQALARPDSAPIPREPAVLYALVGAITERIRTGAAPAAAAIRYASRLPDEFALLAVRDLLAVSPALAGDPSVQAWITQARGRDLFLAA